MVLSSRGGGASFSTFSKVIVVLGQPSLSITALTVPVCVVVIVAPSGLVKTVEVCGSCGANPRAENIWGSIAARGAIARGARRLDVDYVPRGASRLYVDDVARGASRLDVDDFARGASWLDFEMSH